MVRSKSKVVVGVAHDVAAPGSPWYGCSLGSSITSSSVFLGVSTVLSFSSSFDIFWFGVICLGWECLPLPLCFGGFSELLSSLESTLGGRSLIVGVAIVVVVGLLFKVVVSVQEKIHKWL